MCPAGASADAGHRDRPARSLLERMLARPAPRLTGTRNEQPGRCCARHSQPQRDLTALVQKPCCDLVKRIAYHLAGRLPPQVEVEDLMQAGMMGLLEAAQHYTSGRGASFETYAGIRIRGAMLDALRKLDWAPRSVHRKARAAALALREVEARRGSEATRPRSPRRWASPLPEYQRIIQDALGCQLLHSPTPTTAKNRAWTAFLTRADPEGVALDDSMRQAIIDAVQELPERERLVLSLYYKQELNLKEIGVVLKVTESRVCQLHGQALLRLKARLHEWQANRGRAHGFLSIVGLLLAAVVDRARAPSSRAQGCMRCCPRLRRS